MITINSNGIPEWIRAAGKVPTSPNWLRLVAFAFNGACWFAFYELCRWLIGVFK
jgi:hypothetical protein